LIHLNYWVCIWSAAAIVLIYIFLGGLTSAIYNEVLQFFLIVFGFAPLVFLGLRDIGGWSALKEKLVPVATARNFAPGAWSESWSHMGSALDNPMGVNWFGMVMGLGFVLSFGYWCTDFLVVQRAMAAKSMEAARRTPLIAAIPKMLFPALVILPGMIAMALHHQDGGRFLPLNGDGTPNYNQVVPAMLATYFPTGILGLGFTALLASFMSGMAGNVTAFNTVWTYDIYQSYVAPKESDEHYLWMGRGATVFGVLVSVGTAYMASKFDNIMDMLQLVFSFVNAPLFATFLLGMFWKRSTGHGAFFGLLGGTLGAAIFHGLSISEGSAPGVKGAWLARRFVFHSEMSQNFSAAIVAWTTCFLLTIAISLATRRMKSDEELKGLVYSLTPKPKAEAESWYARPAILGIIILAVALVLNLVFW
jgi:SSS family solute:Na+ symporter